MEAVGGQKHPSKAKNGMKELIYWKKYLKKFLNNLKNPLEGPIIFELRPQGRKLLFLNSEVMEVVRGQKHYRERRLWHLTQHSVHPTAPYHQF